MLIKIIKHLFKYYSSEEIIAFKHYITDNSDKIEKRVNYAINASEPATFKDELNIIIYSIIDFLRGDEND